MVIEQYLGDSKTHAIPMIWDGAPFVPDTGWEALFTAKYKSEDPDSAAVFQKSSGAGLSFSGSFALITTVGVDTDALTVDGLTCDVRLHHLTTGERRTVSVVYLKLLVPRSRNVLASLPIYTTEPRTEVGRISYKTSSFTAFAYGRYVVASEDTLVVTNPTTGVLGESFEVVIAAGGATIQGITYYASRFPITVVCSVAPSTWITLPAVLTETLAVGKALILPATTPATLTADQNNYSPTAAGIIRLSASGASRSITGLAFSPGQADGQQHLLLNASSQAINLVHNSAASLPQNRFQSSTGASITLTSSQQASIWYDATIQRWRISKNN
jgi:hypothetical protein